MIHLSEEKLKELMAKAYEAGWYGVFELKDSAVEKIYAGFKSSSDYHPVTDTIVLHNDPVYYIASSLSVQWNV